MRQGRWHGALLCALGLLVAAYPNVSDAQGGHRWGVGSFGGYSVPMFGMLDHFSGTEQFGATWQYEHSSRLILELEYHHSKFDRSKEVDKTFNWAVDGKDYLSPNAMSRITFNSALINLLVTPQAMDFKQENFEYYVAVGTGIYGYKSERRNFVYPAQKNAPLDVTNVLNPQIDERAALGVNAGFGVQAFILRNFSIDLRARYHVVIGELRPMSAWGYDTQTFPLQFLQVGAGLKFYFVKS